MRTFIKLFMPIVLIVFCAILIPLVDAWFVEDYQATLNIMCQIFLWALIFYFVRLEIIRIVMKFKGLEI